MPASEALTSAVVVTVVVPPSLSNEEWGIVERMTLEEKKKGRESSYVERDSKREALREREREQADV
jgi:hypothetical protein